MNDIDKEFQEKLVTIAKTIAENSEGRIIFVKDEEFEGFKEYFQVIHYLETEKGPTCSNLIGKIIENYTLSQIGIDSIISLVEFYVDIVLPVKNLITSDAYKKVQNEIKEFGISHISRDNEQAKDIWLALFS